MAAFLSRCTNVWQKQRLGRGGIIFSASLWASGFWPGVNLNVFSYYTWTHLFCEMTLVVYECVFSTCTTQEDFAGYDFENRLHVRIHSALASLNTAAQPWLQTQQEENVFEKKRQISTQLTMVTLVQPSYLFIVILLLWAKTVKMYLCFFFLWRVFFESVWS